MDRILISWGPFTIYTFGLSIAVAALVAFWLADREAQRKGIDSDSITSLFLILLVAGILGARLFFVLFYDPAYYWQHPWDIFKIYEGGLSIHGGILGGILAGWWYTKKMGLSFWAAADLFAPALVLGQGIARVGCDVYGTLMTQTGPWGVHFQGQLVHPAQIYETLLDLSLFIFLWGLRERQKYAGQIFIYYLGGYSLIRFVLEFYRINPVWIGRLTPAHVTSIIFLLAALALARWASRYNHIEPTSESAPPLWVSAQVWSAVALLAAASLVIFYSFNR